MSTMYGKVTALPVTGAAAAFGTGISVIGVVLLGVTLLFAGLALGKLAPKFH